MIYMAPLQGYTDYLFRTVFSRHFEGIDTFFIPYISIHNGTVIAKQLKDLFPENNLLKKIVPQVLIKDSDELLQLALLLKDYGYKELNINMGCPYPMVTNRGRGSGLLYSPEKVKSILDECLPKINMNVSVKLRSGLKDENEIIPIIDVLNNYPIKEIIYHPRVASQLYKGKVNEQLYTTIQSKSKNRMVYNGDIFSLEIFRNKKFQFPATERWMLGRGILMNPFLAEEIMGSPGSEEGKIDRLLNFHNDLFNAYQEKLSGSGHVLTKMKQFWEYFSYSFKNQHKTFKLIKKSSTLEKYKLATREVFYNSDK